jgi:hypothetical protein
MIFDVSYYMFFCHAFTLVALWIYIGSAVFLHGFWLWVYRGSAIDYIGFAMDLHTVCYGFTTVLLYIYMVLLWIRIGSAIDLHRFCYRFT